MSEVRINYEIAIYEMTGDGVSNKYYHKLDLKANADIVSEYIGASIIDKMDINDSISIFDSYGRELLENDDYSVNIVDLADIYENLAIYYAPRNTLGEYELRVPDCYASYVNDSLPSEISFTNFAYTDFDEYPRYSLNQNDPIKIRNILKKIKSPNPYTDTL